MTDPLNARRMMLGAAKKFLLDSPKGPALPAPIEPPRLTPSAIQERTRMSRSRERILTNLEEMYSEAFERAKASGAVEAQQQLDFAYRREQLYFEILLDVRDAIEKGR